MALTEEEHAQVVVLDRKISLGKKPLKRYDEYLEGEQPLRYMAPQLEAEVGSIVTQLVINWPMLVVNAFENRLDITGFRYPKSADRDPVIWEWWDHVDGEEQSQLAHFEALGLGRVFAMVGSGDEDGDPPVLTIEHPSQVAVGRDPRTRIIREALYRWQEDDKSEWGQLHLPDVTITLKKQGRTWVDEDRDEHNLNEVPVVPIVHRPRLLRPDGRSLFHDIIPLADAANKMATDMMVSGEFHAMPRRWAIGMSEEDFEDEHGQQMSTWSTVAGRLWTTDRKPAEVAVGQFPEADLVVFHNTIKLLAQLVGQLIGLPHDYLGFQTDNPPSAESRRAAEVRLTKGAERIITWFGSPWKRVGGLFLRFDSGGAELPKEAASLKAVWNDPATPTRAQQVDAIVKLVESHIIPVEQAREDLGYDEEQRRRMAQQDDDASRRSLSLLAEAGTAAVKPAPNAPPPAA
ncbi:MAG: phage portal protein [Actinomycetia bacterium]|nr:phage portal protein [Actinomycetes bacterium]